MYQKSRDTGGVMSVGKLQNGSDIRGVAIELNNEKINLGTREAAAIGQAFAAWLKNGKHIAHPKITVGKDSRITGEILSEALMRGMDLQGADVTYFGLCSTPAMFMSTKESLFDADGAVMVTASHLPYNRNGMKFFIKQGGLDKDDIKKILCNAPKYPSNTDVDKTFKKTDFIKIYSQTLVDYIRQKTASQSPFSGIKIIVDAGNGCGGFFVDNVLKTLGADTLGSVFLDPDGMFPNHVPNPENPQILANFGKKVLSEKADLGIIFDTDVDRAALIDSDGTPIARNRLIALLSDLILFEHPGSYIVTDSITSKSLTEYIIKRGGVHHRFMRGYNNVIREGKRLNEAGKPCWMAVETSGHCALKENDFLDDGAFLVVKALAQYIALRKCSKTFSDVLADYKDPAEEKEIRYAIIEEDYKTYGKLLLDHFIAYVKTVSGWSLEEPNYEGVRVNCDKSSGDGWLLMRLSLHDPVLPVNIESDTAGGVSIIENILNAFLKNYRLE